MKNIFLAFIFFGIVGCASSYNAMDQYNSLQGKHKAMAVAVNSSGQTTGGAGWDVGNTIYEARTKAIKQCKKYNPQFRCLIKWENNDYVLSKNLASTRSTNSKRFSSSTQSQNIYSKYTGGQCYTRDCYTKYLTRKASGGQCETNDCYIKYLTRKASGGQCETNDCYTKYLTRKATGGQCETIECYSKYLGLQNSPSGASRYYSRGKSDEEDEEEEEEVDDSWFDEGTPQCDEGTWYEENGYC